MCNYPHIISLKSLLICSPPRCPYLFYSYQLDKADRRNCADRIIELLNSRHYRNWSDLNDDIYHRADKLSNKLLSLDEEKCSSDLDKFISAKRYAEKVLLKVMSSKSQKENDAEFLSSQDEVDKLRLKLIQDGKKLKKK